MTEDDPGKLIQKALESKVFPGIAALVEQKGRILFRGVYGRASVFPEERPLDDQNLFGLASLTKPLATAPVLLSLMEREAISPDEVIGRFLPKLNRLSARLRLKDLFLHTSGLPPVPDLFHLFTDGNCCNKKTALDRLYQIQPEIPPRTEVRYSCTGFILLGLAAEVLGGKPLDQLFYQLIRDPAGLHNLMFTPSAADRIRAVTEEYDPWRGRWIQGEVHDENAWVMGGVSGNAGLFGTLDAVAALMELFRQEGRIGGRQILDPETIRLMTTGQTGGIPGDPRAFGFAAHGKDIFAGPGFSEGAFGHTGFTGTSVWIDPQRDLKIILLTNRVHFGREETAEKIKQFRRDFHRLFL
jgi:CubicO group peptidase (beta-lactamase class C family)